MQFLRWVLGGVLIISQLMTAVPVRAASMPQIVISQLQTGGNGIGMAGQEFIEIYNNSIVDVNVTGWYLTYSSAADGTQSTVFRIVAPDAQTALWLKARNHVVFVSPDYKLATRFAGDGTFSYTNGMAAAGGHIRLFSAAGEEVDKVAWGVTTVVPPEATAPAPQGGKALQRIGSELLQVTGNSTNDFIVATPLLHSGGIYEIVTTIDVCLNIEGAQSIIPKGYLADGSGDCQPDSCTNLAGLQLSVPAGYDSDSAGDCFVHDECSNVAGVQTIIPEYMARGSANECVWELPPLLLTELLPNANGSDTGNEFIEIYNPTERTLDLTLYGLKVGAGGEKSAAFPTGSTIAPGEYRVFSDKQLGVTLVNANSRVVLTGIDGTIMGDSGTYQSAPEGQSWALFGNVWLYTNRPTPGMANLELIIEEASNSTDTPAPCAEGKYRNPLTNRCRNIATDVSILASCDEGQYRNPETNRCRKITTTALTPCKEDQYRSEETNRCRNIVMASVQKPCKDNQYRSEETNRCRNLTATSVPASTFAVQPIKDGAMAFVGWWALGGVGLLAAGYGAWEWRREIENSFNTIVSRFSGKR